MTPLDLIRERLDAGFIFCSFAAPGIRQELGVRHLSQVWTRLPSWYVWLDDTPGAFMLELRGGAQFSAMEIACQGAVGVIRYFPPLDRMGALNSEEAVLLRSEVFDRTGTPHWEQLDEIVGTERFVVGTFELHCPNEGDDLYVLFESTRLNLSDNPGALLFDRLVGMQAYSARHRPSGPFSWGENGRAAAICSDGGGETFLRHYLAPEQFAIAANSDAAARNWSALACREPVAAEGTGCCCH